MLCGYWIVWEQDQVALSDSIAIFFVFVYLVSVYLVCIKIKANIEYWIHITQWTDIGQALSIYVHQSNKTNLLKFLQEENEKNMFEKTADINI